MLLKVNHNRLFSATLVHNETDAAHASRVGSDSKHVQHAERLGSKPSIYERFMAYGSYIDCIGIHLQATSD
jgi:hypothetical protein